MYPAGKRLRSGYVAAYADRAAGISPCKDCPDRYPGCGGECEKYKAWKEKRTQIINQYRDKAQEENEADGVLRAGMLRAVRAANKKEGTKGR